MRNLLCALALVLAAACGGTSSSPAAPANAGGASGADDVPVDPELCCCELPADEPLYQMEPTEQCETDSHGVCVEADLCGA